MKIHTQVHSSEVLKFCHYFNNEKNCPYDKLGCKFLHQHAERCYFGEKCKNKLCQFKHTDQKDMLKDELTNKFNKLTDMEKDEAKEVFCDIYCNRGYDSHRCPESCFL